MNEEATRYKLREQDGGHHRGRRMQDKVTIPLPTQQTLGWELISYSHKQSLEAGPKV